MLTIDKINDEIANVIIHGNNRQDVFYLASLFICRQNLQPTGDIGSVKSESEFVECVKDKRYADVVSAMDKLMCELKGVNPRFYQWIMERLNA